MVNNFTEPSEEEIWQDNNQANSFFERAKKITKDSISDIYTLIENISDYCQVHYTQHRDQLLILLHYLSECIASVCNHDDTGFVHLSVFLETKDSFVEKGWLS